ncbi:hypothetical protein [Haloplanus salilacus]|uniref:hypothetical protein n=1 Tax=Haloplanus salilacus TaxID=2949994 RepID=UPI0030CBEB5A
MTGIVSRFRDWLGSLFGGSDDDETTDQPRIEGSGSTVTHRDDRPLETPDVPPTASESVVTPEAETDDRRGDPTDTEATPETDSDPVTIPDAESGTEPAGEAGPGRRADSEPGPGPDDLNAPVEGAAGRTTADDASTFECAVCGTAVEDPAHSCPLCRSSEVVPATEPGRES